VLGSSFTNPNSELWSYRIENYLLQILEVTSPGTLFAFSTMFRNLDPVDIIVWRPAGVLSANTSASRMYSVLWKITVTASSILNEEFVSVEIVALRPVHTVYMLWTGLYSIYSSMVISLFNCS
jgi:hypothetical protein